MREDKEAAAFHEIVCLLDDVKKRYVTGADANMFFLFAKYFIVAAAGD